MLRSLIYVGLAEGVVDERSFNPFRRICEHTREPTVQELKAALRERSLMLRLDLEAALAALAQLLDGTAAGTAQAAAAHVRQVATAAGSLNGEAAVRLEAVEAISAATVRQAGEGTPAVEPAAAIARAAPEMTAFPPAAPSDRPAPAPAERMEPPRRGP